MELALARRYKRWRHGRGFGIHSPFAYDFITLTLRERLPYYGYDDIAAAVASSDAQPSISEHRLRLIFRIAVRFNPSSVAIVGDKVDPALTATLKAVRQDVTITDQADEVDFIIVNGATSLNLCSEKAVMLFPDTRRAGFDTLDRVWRQVGRGMRFDNGRGFSIIVADPKLPRQQFDVLY